MERSIIHIDMDAFYASIEQKDNPEYSGRPIAVGGSAEKRGVICTASYEARRYGVRSAMSSRMALKLCPNLLILPVRMERYIEISKQIREILEEYSNAIEPISIDEAFLDVTGKDPINIAMNIKQSIKVELGLTSSIGISHNKYLAKLASDIDKPNGLKVIKKEEAKDFLANLPIRKLWGVGPKTEKVFHQLGILKISDLLEYNKDIIIKKFGRKGHELIDFANGKDDRSVESTTRRKSIGEETTFDTDIEDINVFINCIRDYCYDLCSFLENRKLMVKTVTIKIKYEDFTSITRSLTLLHYTRSFSEILDVAINLLREKVPLNKKIRLLGIQLSNILYPDEPIQIKMDI